MKKILALSVIGAALALGGCTSDAIPANPVTLDYSQLGKIGLDVGKIQIVNRAPTGQNGFAAALRPQLADAVYRWGADRLQAAGRTGTATLAITEATLTRENLQVAQGWEHWFDRQQAEKWTAKVSATLNVADSASGVSGYASANATRMTSLPEDASAAEQQAAYHRLLSGLMQDLNAQLDKSIRTHLGAAVLR